MNSHMHSHVQQPPLPPHLECVPGGAQAALDAAHQPQDKTAEPEVAYGAWQNV
jgi:hypothetical protein